MGLPTSYRQLARYAARYPAGEAVYDQGAVPACVYIVLSGRLEFRIVDADGEVSVVAEALPGQLAGHVAAITGRPTSAAAHAAEESVLIGVPVGDLVEAFRIAPELALKLIHQFAKSDQRAPAVQAPAPPTAAAAEPATDAATDATTDVATDLAADASSEPATGPAPEPARQAARVQPSTPGLAALEDGWDETFFFSDTTTCTVCTTTFEFLRVRTSAVRPASRDSDFRVVYSSHDPTRYSIVVCPTCGYAAYFDDFDTLEFDERAQLVGSQAERDALGARGFRGPRELTDAALAIDLALASYAHRRTNERRHAVLLHRRSWIERERGDAVAEHRLLLLARETYQGAFERDTSITDDAAMRAAYIIGDLSLRLEDVTEATRWLGLATRSPEAKKQSGLSRLAWEQLQAAHELAKRLEAKVA